MNTPTYNRLTDVERYYAFMYQVQYEQERLNARALKFDVAKYQKTIARPMRMPVKVVFGQ